MNFEDPVTWERWYENFCSMSPETQVTVFQVAAYIFATVGAAAILANARSHLPGWLVFAIDMVGANWKPMIRRHMDGASRSSTLGALALLVLAGCSSADRAVQLVADNLDDACFYAGTAEGLFEIAAQSRDDGAAMFAYAAVKVEIDGICTKPYPTDTQQAVARLAVLAVQLVPVLVAK